MIYIIMTVPRIKLFTEANLLHAKRCNIYRIYHLNELQVEFKSTNFVDRLYQGNQILNDRIWTIRYFQTHNLLSKFALRNMPFKTSFTSLVNMQGLTDSASLKESIKITAVKVGAITDLKLLGGVYSLWMSHDTNVNKVMFPQITERKMLF